MYAEAPGRAAAGRSLVGVCLLVTILLAASGCGRPDSPSPGPGQAADGEILLERMVAAYRQCRSYADSGEVRLQYKLGSEQFDRTYDFSVTWAAPNKLRMHVNDAVVVCDGKDLFVGAANFPTQVLRRPVPQTFSLEFLYGDEIVRRLLTQWEGGAAMQLSFLLEPQPLGAIFATAESIALLEAEPLEDRLCHRVEVVIPEGRMVFWVDQQSFVLRRFEYPTEGFRQALAQTAQVSDVSMVADFKGARFDAPIDPQAFRFELPPGVNFVDKLDPALAVDPPPPLSPLLGQKIGDFSFTLADGQQATRDSLAGKVVVIEFWATTYGLYLDGLEGLKQAWQRYGSDERVRFLAVNIDDPPKTGDQIRQAVASADLPVALDGQGHNQTVFQVQHIPARFILDADGVVEDAEVGPCTDLAQRIEKLLAGQSLVDDARMRHEERLRKYQQAVAAASAQSAPHAIPRADIAPRSEPSAHRLTRAWLSKDLAQPGNILVVADGDAPRILVNEGFRAVGELSLDGRLIARHGLLLPESPSEAVVTYLRTAVDAQGRRWFAASGPAQQQLHVFDDHFTRVLSFPEGTHDGISDIQMADLDGDGQPALYVSYWGVVGVQAVSLQGRRLWSNRQGLENVSRLAIVRAGRDGRPGIVLSDGRGAIVPITAEGRDASPFVLPDRYAWLIMSADPALDGESRLMVVAASPRQELFAVRLDPAGQPLWEYQLPFGVQPVAALEMVAAGPLLGDDGQWVLAGADGSIHILDDNGRLRDRFQYGTAIAGLAVVGAGQQRLLLVSTAQGVEALAFEPKGAD